MPYPTSLPKCLDIKYFVKGLSSLTYVFIHVVEHTVNMECLKKKKIFLPRTYRNTIVLYIFYDTIISSLINYS